MTEISDDAKRNRADWTKANADYADQRASHTWAAEEITWGVFGVPEASLNTLGDVDGLDVVELGRGTAYLRLARKTRCPSRRCRRDSGAARHRPPLPERVPNRLSACRGQCRERPAPAGAL